MAEGVGRQERKEVPGFGKRLSVLFSAAAIAGALTIGCDREGGQIDMRINELTPTPRTGQQAPEIKPGVELERQTTAPLDELEKAGFEIVDKGEGNKVLGFRGGSSFVSDEVVVDSQGYWQRRVLCLAGKAPEGGFNLESLPKGSYRKVPEGVTDLVKTPKDSVVLVRNGRELRLVTSLKGAKQEQSKLLEEGWALGGGPQPYRSIEGYFVVMFQPFTGEEQDFLFCNQKGEYFQVLVPRMDRQTK